MPLAPPWGGPGPLNSTGWLGPWSRGWVPPTYGWVPTLGTNTTELPTHSPRHTPSVCPHAKRGERKGVMMSVPRKVNIVSNNSVGKRPRVHSHTQRTTQASVTRDNRKGPPKHGPKQHSPAAWQATGHKDATVHARARCMHRGQDLLPITNHHTTTTQIPQHARAAAQTSLCHRV